MESSAEVPLPFESPLPLRINEIFHSVQGESTWAGAPCVFVRLTGCPLRCGYCDTEYAFREGALRERADILRQVLAYDCDLVEITGGEPLAQREAFDLIRELLDAGRTVLIETSGAINTTPVDPRAHIILDIKTPGSGEANRMDWSNVDRLRAHDEVKFVICSRGDYEFARETTRTHRLIERCRCVLFSPVHEQPRGVEIGGMQGLSPRDLAAWVLADGLRVRVQMQLHKIIWEPQTRGV
ncbi:MAG: radical SAM protein [Planctomycetes bacterium]|nr:radical SAM protein [Planctomycetota bacterium]